VWTFVYEHGKWQGRSFLPDNEYRAISTEWYGRFEAVVWAIEVNNWS
jgi:hypothetical protein